jgi:hypothetical protein
MHTCDQCSDLLLDHLYGLLDEGEARELRDHLAACPACRSALAQAESQQTLLARAAQVYAEVPAFSAPTAELPLEPAPTSEPAAADTAVQSSPPDAGAPAKEAPEGPGTLPLPPRRRRPRWALAWLGAAAGLLLAVLGLYEWQRYGEGLAARQDGLRRARKEVTALDARLAHAVADYKDRLAALPAQVEGDFLHVRLTGPASYQRSAPAQYHVTTRGLDGKLSPATLTVRLIDPLRAGRPVFEKQVESRGEQTVVLPAGLEVRPGSLPRLEVEAQRGSARERLEQPLAIPGPACATHLVTNKPAYRPGELMFFRSLTLDRFSLKPPEKELRLTFTLVGPYGPTGLRLDAMTSHGIAGGEFAVTPSLPEGEYVLQVAAASPGGNAGPLVLPTSRRVVIAHDESPQLQFDRAHYAPGESGVALFRGRLQPSGLPAPNQPVTAQASLNGQPLPLQGTPPGRPAQLLTDSQGKAEIPFQVPAVLARKGEVQVQVQVHDGLRNETVAQAASVVPRPPLPPLSVDFFPEGGELVAGLPARVYFQARNARGEPVAVQGRVVDPQGREVPQAHTAGAFEFTPAAGQRYALKVLSPKGAGQPVALPEVRPEGVGLSVANPVGREGDPIRVRVRAARPGPALLVVASCRGRLVDQREVTPGPDGSVVELRPAAGARGVVCVAVCELRQGELVPLAERLVHRAAADPLVLSVSRTSGDKDKALSYPPGSPVDLTARVRTASGKPASGWLLGLVVDANAPQPTALRRGPEGAAPSPGRVARGLADLAEAELLLSGVARSPEALDHFLGTHVERRFAFPGRPAGAGLQDKEALARARAGLPAVLIADSGREALKQRYQQALARRQAEQRAQAERERDRLQAERPALAEDVRLAALELSRYEAEWGQYLQVGLLGLAVVLFAVSAVVLTVGLGRLLGGGRSATPSFALASLGLVACATLLLLLPNSPFSQDGSGQGRDLGRAEKRWEIPPLPTAKPGPPEERHAGLGKLFVLPGEEAEREQSSSLQQDKAKGGAPDAGDRKQSQTAHTGRGGGSGHAKSSGDAAAPEVASGKPGEAKSADFAKRFQEAMRRHPAPQPPSPPSGAPDGKGGMQPYAPGPAPGGFPNPGFGGGRPGVGKAKGKGGKKGPGLVEKPDKTGGEKQAEKKAPGGKADVSPEGGGVFVLKPYVHHHPPGTREYQDTVFWHPDLFAADGTARLRFDLSSAATTYRVLLFAHDDSGRLGAFEGKLRAEK